MTHLKVEGHSNLVRDENTKAILNTNMSDYNQYMKLKSIKENDNKKIEALENNIDDIKNDLEEIKSLLGNLLNGSK
jgi:tetrahydromethanopterin S-methyltransferase subunit B